MFNDWPCLLTKDSGVNSLRNIQFKRYHYQYRFGRHVIVIWLTGLSAAGKSTLGEELLDRLQAMGRKAELLDGDVIRQLLSRDLGFSKQDRDENIRRIGFVAELLAKNGIVVIVSAISPYRAMRDEVRRRIPDFVEVYINAPVEVCERRDVKGLYRRARAGELREFSGINDPYEPPIEPEVECKTDLETIDESVQRSWHISGSDESKARIARTCSFLNSVARPNPPQVVNGIP